MNDVSHDVSHDEFDDLFADRNAAVAAKRVESQTGSGATSTGAYNGADNDANTGASALVLPAECSGAHVEPLQAMFLAYANQALPCHVDGRNVLDIDFAGLQCLTALWMTRAANGGETHLLGMSDVLRDSISAVGLDGLLECEAAR